MRGRRFRASSWGAGAIILALLLLILHRFGSFWIFFLVGAGLLWYGRMQRDAEEKAAEEKAAAAKASEEREAAERKAPDGAAPEPPEDADGRSDAG